MVVSRSGGIFFLWDRLGGGGASSEVVMIVGWRLLLEDLRAVLTVGLPTDWGRLALLGFCVCVETDVFSCENLWAP